MNFSDLNGPLWPQTEEFTVEKVRKAVQYHIPGFPPGNLDVRQRLDAVTNAMVLTLVADLAGNDTSETQNSLPRVLDTEAVPLTWWDHVKQTLQGAYPKFFGRLTVRERNITKTLTQTVTTRTTRLCPHIGVESQYAHLRFLASQPLYFSNEDIVRLEDNRHRREWEAQNGRTYPVPAKYPPWTSPHNF